jgi:hypothetical protein
MGEAHHRRSHGTEVVRAALIGRLTVARRAIGWCVIARGGIARTL